MARCRGLPRSVSKLRYQTACSDVALTVDSEARRRHLRVTGTLGVLRTAAEHGLVNVTDLVTRLRATSFYVDDALVNDVFAQWLE